MYVAFKNDVFKETGNRRKKSITVIDIPLLLHKKNVCKVLRTKDTNKRTRDILHKL